MISQHPPAGKLTPTSLEATVAMAARDLSPKRRADASSRRPWIDNRPLTRATTPNVTWIKPSLSMWSGSTLITPPGHNAVHSLVLPWLTPAQARLQAGWRRWDGLPWHVLTSARVTGWGRRAAVVLGAAAVGLVVDRPPAQPARMARTTARRGIARIDRGLARPSG